MDGLLTFSAGHQFAVLLALGVLVVLVIILMVAVIVRGGPGKAPSADKEPPSFDLVATPLAAGEGTDAKQAVTALRQLLNEGYRAYRDRYSRNPYLMPWVLRVGGSNDDGFLDAVEEIQAPVGAPTGAGVRWRYYERGIVIDVLDPTVLRAVLTFVVRKRPSLPFDGVIVALPITRLIDAPSANSAGVEVYNQLWLVQKVLGFSIPLYFTLTGAEGLAGVHSLEGILPTAMRSSMLGWSSPYPLEVAFSADHVHDAVMTIEQAMIAVALEAFGSVVDERLGALLIRCKEDMAGLEEPLTTFLATALRRTAFQESHYFRGIYFAARPAPGEPASFTADLLERKIFAESRLSKPVRGPDRWRNGKTIAWVSAAAVLAVFGLGSIIVSASRLGAYQDLVTPVLKATAVDIDAVNNRPAQGDETVPTGEAAIRYLRNASMLTEAEPFVFAPLTWIGGDHYHVDAAMRAGWRRLVLKALKLTLDKHLEALTHAPPASDTPDTALTNYLGQVAEAEAFSKVFNEMTAGGDGGKSGADLPVRDVLQYAFGISVPTETIEKLRTWRAIGSDAEAVDDPDLQIDIDHYHAGVLAAFHDVADAYFKQLAQGGQVGVRLAVVARELAAVAQGGRQPMDDEASLLEVSNGLQEASTLLAAGRPSWVGASSAVIPDDIAKLLDLATLSRLLGPDSKTQVLAIAQQRYAEVKDTVGQINSVVGPLAQRGDNGVVTLTPGAESLRQALTNWFGRPFMQHAATPAAPPADGGLPGWDAIGLEAIPRYFDDYQLFYAKTLSQLPEPIRASARVVAQTRLYGSVKAVLDKAAPPVNPELIGARATLPQLKEAARLMKAAYPVLEQAIQSYQQIGMPGPAGQVHDRVSGFALALLDRVNRTLDQGQPYQINAIYLNSWYDGALDPAQLFGQSGNDGLGQYLSATRLEISTLARDVAAPVVEVMSRPVMATGAPPSAARWQKIASALDQYDASAPSSSLMSLEKFIREDIPKTTNTSCFTVNSPGSYADDFFAARLAAIEEAVHHRCVTVAEERLLRGYRDLASFFNDRLAGRMPFSATDDGGAADPAAIREFYAEMDSYGHDVIQPVSALVGEHPQLQSASQFLQEMKAARPLLTYIASGGSVALRPKFRVNRPNERNAASIIEWTLHVGDQTVSSFSPKAVVWQLGDPVSLDLRWAKDGQVRPIQALGPLDGGVQGLSATYKESGTWSVFGFILNQTPGMSVRVTGAKAGQAVMAFEARTGPMTAPSQVTITKTAPAVDAAASPVPIIPPARTADTLTPAGEPVVADTRVFMSLDFVKLVAAAAGGATKGKDDVLPLVNLPVAAPTVPLGSLQDMSSDVERWATQSMESTPAPAGGAPQSAAVPAAPSADGPTDNGGGDDDGGN